MKLFKHEHKDADPVHEPVEPEQRPAPPEPVLAATEPTVATHAFGRMTEHQDDGDLVITAEMAGLDPDKDVELSVSDGVLRIEAQHRQEDTTNEDGYVRRELRYARILRTLPLPAGVSEADVKASYRDGVLEVRVPAGAPKPHTPPATKVPITTT
jgi:HSP20 family protein